MIARAKQQSAEKELNWEDYKKMEFTQCVSIFGCFVMSWEPYESLINNYPLMLIVRIMEAKLLRWHL